MAKCILTLNIFIMTEEQLHTECYRWFWNEYPNQRGLLFHVDNNSYNSVIGARKKALGVVSGVSDLILVLPRRVVFIELKVPGGKQSDAQVEFERNVGNRGHEYYLVYSLIEFKQIITEAFCGW
jgi:hypothetical protein